MLAHVGAEKTLQKENKKKNRKNEFEWSDYRFQSPSPFVNGRKTESKIRIKQKQKQKSQPKQVTFNQKFLLLILQTLTLLKDYHKEISKLFLTDFNKLGRGGV